MNALVTRRWLGSDLGGLHRDLDSIFETVFGRREASEPAWAPRVETFVKDDTIHVRADLPGVDPKDLDVSLEKDVLTVRGERKATHEDAAYREVSYGRFERHIRVPEGLDPAAVTARYANGVLEVTVPVPKPVTKKIAIQTTA